MSDSVREPVVVDFTYDVICVHSYLGFTRLQRALATGGRAEIRYLPYELAPGASTDGMPLLDALAQTFGAAAVAHTVQFAAMAAAEGITLDYTAAIATGTFEAHRLIAAAAEQDCGAAMLDRLFRAHFADGLNIGDAETLTRLAAEIGVTGPWPEADTLRAELDRVRRHTPSGVPVVTINGAVTLTGSYSEAAYAKALAGLV